MTAQRSEKIALNSDMGEAFGLHTFGFDKDLMPMLDAANIACGFHAGDPNAMAETVLLAKEHDVAIGAHPGLPDLVGFGRREMKLTPEEVENIVRYQVGALTGFLKKYDLELNHIKPHGSLYGMLARDPELMAGAVAVAKEYDVSIFGIAGTMHQTVSEEAGVDFVGELYVDLDYNSEGGLVILRKPKPVDPVLAAERVSRALQDGIVMANDGTTELKIDFSSVCVHSDTSNSVDITRAVREVLDQA